MFFTSSLVDFDFLPSFYYFTLNYLYHVASLICHDLASYRGPYKKGSWVANNGPNLNLLPMACSRPCPVVIPISNVTYVEKKLDEMVEICGKARWGEGICYRVEDSQSEFKESMAKDLKIACEQLPKYEQYTAVKQVISRMIRSCHEVEFFDHTTVSDTEMVHDQGCDKSVIRSENRGNIKSFWVDHQEIREEWTDEIEMRNLTTFIGAFKAKFNNLVVYKTSHRNFGCHDEENGYLWILGEYEDYLAGCVFGIADDCPY